MNGELLINGEKYIPATLAGKHFGYTKDYFLLLIKNKKIAGEKVGNKWYVSVSSAHAFFELAKKLKLERSEKIRSERKAELETRRNTSDQQSSLAANDTAQCRTLVSSTETVASPVVVENLPVHKKYARAAVIETCAIVVIGFMFGASVYLGFATSTPLSTNMSARVFSEHLALSVYDYVQGEPNPVVVIADDTAAQTPALVTDDTEKKSLVIAPASEMSTTTATEIQETFSDEVRVAPDPENEGVGIITPIFKEKEGEAYRYVMVPVTTQ